MKIQNNSAPLDKASPLEAVLQPGIPTESLAAALSLKAATLRRRLCLTGSYFGVIPIKLPNGKLRWPQDSIAMLLKVGEH